MLLSCKPEIILLQLFLLPQFLLWGGFAVISSTGWVLSSLQQMKVQDVVPQSRKVCSSPVLL